MYKTNDAILIYNILFNNFTTKTCLPKTIQLHKESYGYLSQNIPKGGATFY